MFTLTDRAYETMWRHLHLLSHEMNARRLLQGQLSAGRTACLTPDDLERKARQVAYCIVQASEYYKAADSVTIDTSPLLYFYGMLALSKALIVANEPGTLLDDIKYHGLKAERSAALPALEEQRVRTDDGVFARLTNVIQGFRYPKGAAFVLMDVLSISPELSDVYERIFNAPARCLIRYHIRLHSINPYSLEVCVVAPDADYISKRIPELVGDFDLRPNTQGGESAWFKWFRSKPSLPQPPRAFWPYNPAEGGEYLVGALPYYVDGNLERRYLYPPLSDYIGMFVLSDCVRYRQDLWRGVVQGRETGVLGLIELFIDVSRRRFPNLILDQLFKEPFEYWPKRQREPRSLETTHWPIP